MKKLLFSVILGILALALVPSVLAYNQGIDYNAYRFDVFDSDLNDFGHDYKFGDSKYGGHHSYSNVYITPYTKVYESSYRSNYFNRDARYVRNYFYDYPQRRYNNDLHDFFSYGPRAYVVQIDTSYSKDHGLYTGESHYFRAY